MSSSHRIAASGPSGPWPRRLVAGRGRWASVLLAAAVGGAVGGAAGLAVAIAPAVRTPVVDGTPAGESMRGDAAAFDGALAQAPPAVARVLAPAAGIEGVVPRDSHQGPP